MTTWKLSDCPGDICKVLSWRSTSDARKQHLARQAMWSEKLPQGNKQEKYTILNMHCITQHVYVVMGEKNMELNARKYRATYMYVSLAYYGVIVGAGVFLLTFYLR